VLQKGRSARGAIDFDLPETKIVFGKDRKIEKIVPYERFDSHRVIEECMLSANICAAQFIQKHDHPGLYRVHQGPKDDKLEDLRRFLKEMGLKMAVDRAPRPADYAQILRAVKDRPDAKMIQTVLLRSMSQAIYSPDNKGHFGLAYDAYAHFTSPIRRYPDLLVHRAIKQILKDKHARMDLNTFAKAGEHCSMTERRADDATSDVTDWLKCEFMMDKVGMEFDGTISGVTSFGVFVELADIYVEGLVHISALPDDYYQFDAIQHVLRGEQLNSEYKLGNPIKIKVARVDLDQTKIDFVLAGIYVQKGERTKKQKGGRLSQKKETGGKKDKAKKGKSKSKSKEKKKRHR
jgi:ribonuclease R